MRRSPFALTILTVLLVGASLPAITAMADEAPGDRNGTLILPGSAYAQAIFASDQGDALVDAVLVFLNETVVWER